MVRREKEDKMVNKMLYMTEEQMEKITDEIVSHVETIVKENALPEGHGGEFCLIDIYDNIASDIEGLARELEDD